LLSQWIGWREMRYRFEVAEVEVEEEDLIGA
jgi:hypothetical protein